MEEQSRASINGNATKGRATIADLKVRIAEHILAQYGSYGTTDVRNILNETKVGASRRTTLRKFLTMVFPTS
jgi:hypothetical protein